MTVQWLIIVAVFAGAAQILLFRRFALASLAYERRFSQRAVYAGERLELVETIANRGRLPLPWVKLEAVFGSGLRFAGRSEMRVVAGQAFQYHRSVFHLSPRLRITRRHALIAAERGYHSLQPVSMTAGDLFGLARKTVDIRPHSELFVYPRALPIAEIPHPAHSFLGDIAVRRFILSDPFLTAGVRAYRPGDPLRSIHWGATARTGSLQVRQEDFTADYRLMLYVNFECDEDMWEAVSRPELVETALSYASSIAAYASAQGLAVGFGANAKLAGGEDERACLDPAAGREHLETVLRAMARLTMFVTRSFQGFLAQEIERGVNGCDVLILTAFVSDVIGERMDGLRALGNAVDVLYVAAPGAPAKEDPPAEGGGV